ncbi:MAG TPA: alpha/beta hydrolase [Solirubrobacteraceae bacterium]|jgi:pimeloyl-ACP methyl ester carboxylesterase
MSSVSSPAKPDAGEQPYGPVGRSPWLDVDWSQHQHWTIINDFPVNFIDLGEGPPLVFIHGLGGSWPNWLEQLPVFAGQTADRFGGHSLSEQPRTGQRQEDVSPSFGSHRVIAVDLPGFGHSPMPRETISISGYARTLDALLNTLGIDAAAIVGNSMGGFVAAELAINFPRRVERLVLVSAAGLSTYNDRTGTRALSGLRRAERVISAYAGWIAAHSDAVARRRGLRNATLGFVASHPGRIPAALAAEQIRGAGKPGFVQALAANLDYDFRDRLAEIACPTLIVWGDKDRVITARDADRFAELIPGSRKVVFEDTGHIPMLERPAAFNALLDEFLNE